MTRDAVESNTLGLNAQVATKTHRVGGVFFRATLHETSMEHDHLATTVTFDRQYMIKV